MTMSASPATAPDTPQVEAIRAAVAALNIGDAERYAAAFTSDCTRAVVGASEPLPMDAVMAGLQMFIDAFEGFRLVEELMFGQGRHVCAHWRMTGTHTGEYFGIEPTRRRIAFETAEIYEFEREDGGLVRASWSFADMNTWLDQLRNPA